MNRLKELRLSRGLLQSDIAKVINKSERTVGFYETGERDMGTETLGVLADFFGVSVDYILGRDTITEPIEIAASMKDKADLSQMSDKDKEYILDLIERLKGKSE